VRYIDAGKAEKGRILDELVATCGYDRKYAITVLGSAPRSARASVKKRFRRPAYGPDVGAALLRLWRVSRGLCAKRLVPELPALIDAMERHGELVLPDALKEKLLRLSASTASRLLGKLRRSGEHGISTTSPGTLLRHQIPLHTFSDWKDASPGFMEIDLVAHCGDTAAGQFAYTLTAVDVATGWTQTCAILNRGQMAVLGGLEAIIKRLPFPLLGIDTDNGAEFINATLASFCAAQEITFTRGRPYKKNDQCHVEQKNGAVVRPLVGYARYEGQEAVDHINNLYNVHGLHLNYFCPSMKLTDKQRNGAKVVKKYDAPKTAYTRLAEHGIWDEPTRLRMERFYQSLNPAQIGRRIDELEAGLKHHAVRTNNNEQRPIRATTHRLPYNLFGKKTK
jgi:hypothetical protein